MARINGSSEGVRVSGLAELNRALRAMGPEFQKELKETNKSAATFVAADARSAAYSLGGVAAKAAPSLKAKAGNAWAGIGLGGAAYPFAAGAEFGGQGRPTTQQFAPWRGSGSSAGYFVYPTIRRDGPRIEAEYTDAIDTLLERHDLT